MTDVAPALRKAGDVAPEPRELSVRRARKNRRLLAVLRVVDHGSACVVEAEVYPERAASTEPARPGPYRFPNAEAANAFVTDALEALAYLGCETPPE